MQKEVDYMAFTIYDWIYGVVQFAASFMAIIAAIISISLFKSAWKVRVLNAWKYLLFSLILFALVEIAGGLKTFGLMASAPYITHILVSLILGLMITAILVQIDVKRGWIK